MQMHSFTSFHTEQGLEDTGPYARSRATCQLLSLLQVVRNDYRCTPRDLCSEAYCQLLLDAVASRGGAKVGSVAVSSPCKAHAWPDHRSSVYCRGLQILCDWLMCAGLGHRA